MDGRRPAALTLARATLGIAIAAITATFVLPWIPRLPKDELLRTSLWGLALLGSFTGWGTAVAELFWPRGERVSWALRAVWGASALAFLCGALAMVSAVSRPVLSILVFVGLVALVRSWISARASFARGAGARWRSLRLRPALACVTIFLFLAVAVRYLAGASDTTTNPYDDDVSYYPMARQLLEAGALIDPFSFRRMSTLGGQALFHAFALVRVTPLHLNLFDRGMCFVLVIGLLLGDRVDGRRVPTLARLLSVIFLVTLPTTAINSASYYSGLAFFLAFFQTIERLGDTPGANLEHSARRVVPLALVGAALGTLRQNYQVVVALVLVLSYLAFLHRAKTSRREVLREALVAAGLLLLFIAPWLVLLFRSNHTFLFPLMPGTFRPGVDVRSQTMTVARFFRRFVDVWLKPEPITTLPLVMFVGLYIRDRHPRKALPSQWIGGFISLVFLSWAFSLGDLDSLARYVFGFFTASALLTWQRAAVRMRFGGGGSFETFAVHAVLVLALFGRPAITGLHAIDPSVAMIQQQLQNIDELTRRTIPEQREPPVAATYHRIQDAVPAGSRLLVLLDQPYLLDYRRNEIWNLDMPGLSSPAPGIPCFQGPEPIAAYLHGLGIRHVAFVLPDRSRFLYRHDIWFDHLFDPNEVWRVYAPYMTDVMANLAALAETREHVVEGDGMVLLDLERRRAATVP